MVRAVRDMAICCYVGLHVHIHVAICTYEGLGVKAAWGLLQVRYGTCLGLVPGYMYSRKHL